MIERTGDELPERWKATWLAMSDGETEEPGITLQSWLNELYFDSEKTVELTQDDVTKIFGIIQRMLRLEPAARVSAAQILEDPWFQH